MIKYILEQKPQESTKEEAQEVQEVKVRVNIKSNGVFMQVLGEEGHWFSIFNLRLTGKGYLFKYLPKNLGLQLDEYGSVLLDN